MKLSIVPKRMTSFKLSDVTRAQIVRIRELRNAVHSDEFWRQKYTNTDVIRQLCHEEIARLDAASKAMDEAPKAAKKQKIVKAKKSVNTKKGK